MKIFERSRWKARSPRGVYAHNRTPDEMFVHYSAGRGLGIESLAEQAECMRQIQNYHMDSNGWADIGYHVVVFQPYGRLRRARAFRGRPKSAVPAAQMGHNTGTFAVCVVMRDGEALKPATKRLLKQIYKESGCDTVRGHYEVYATACPGTALKAFLPELRASKK